MAPLPELYSEVCDAAMRSICYDIGDGDSARFDFYFDNDNWDISGCGEVGGTWQRTGDGYETPIEYDLLDGWGRLDYLSVTCCDADTGQPITVPTSHIHELEQLLDKAIDSHMKHYQPLF